MIVASYAQIAASIVGPICDGGLGRNGWIIKHFFYGSHNKKILDEPFVDELGTST